MQINDEFILTGIQEEPIDVQSLINKVKDSKGGALSIFLGTTRDHFEDKKVTKLFYEAHPTMALKKLNEIATHTYEKYHLLKIAIFHRVGEPITEESIVIISTAGHRTEAIEATSFAIEEVKKLVPIWKKEIYEEGESQWKENCTCIHKNNN